MLEIHGDALMGSMIASSRKHYCSTYTSSLKEIREYSLAVVWLAWLWRRPVVVVKEVRHLKWIILAIVYESGWLANFHNPVGEWMGHWEMIGEKNRCMCPSWAGMLLPRNYKEIQNLSNYYTGFKIDLFGSDIIIFWLLMIAGLFSFG